ncbi:hypothetical protein ACEPPN_015178 [Leptodophora sp. 'Broadleaf-Isolate-01']
MGGRKNRRRQASADWYASGTDESDTNAAGNHKISELSATGAVGERADSNDSGQTDTRNGTRRTREGKRASPPRLKHESTLGPWTQAVGEVIEGMGATQRAISNLQGMFITHVDDLGMIDETKRRLDQVEEEGREKDEELRRLENTILTLTSMDQKSKAVTESQLAQIVADRRELEQEKTKMESRITVATAEEKHRLNRDFEERMSKQDKSHETRMKELEVEFAQKSQENSKKATALETEQGRLLTVTEQQQKTIKGQVEELERLKDQYDTLDRAKTSFKREKENLERELGTMKQDFAVDTKPAAYFEHKFEEIYGQIEGLSLKYFHDIEGKDLDKIHGELATMDPCFKSVPIDDSDDSRDLRTAHAQRIISKAICEDLWKPFSSALAVQHPGLSDCLSKISDSLDKSSQDGRIANVWTALTIRALQLLQDGTTAPPVLESKKPPSTGSTIAESIISKVFLSLSPLISLSQAETLRTDLHAVVNSSANVWNHAQASGLKITIDPLLDRAYREEWRSQQFDPALPSDGNGTDPDLASNTHPRVFTLFPRVSARIQEDLPPGSFPNFEPTVIYPGVGLPEWSSLVVRGKAYQEEREDYISEALANVMKEANMRASGHRRRASRGSSTSGPPSPSAQWKVGSAVNKGSKTEYE